jgi:hypothetical protein
VQKFKTLAASLIIAFGIIASANASVIVNGTPTGSYNGGWSNIATSQNFMIQFTLESTTTIDSLDIFTMRGYAPVGTSATVRFRDDAHGKPAATNLYKFVAPVSKAVEDNSFGYVTITSVEFAPLKFNAGTYWFGVSGTTAQMAMVSYTTNEQKQRTLSGEKVGGKPNVGDFGYRVHGQVPEPGSITLLGAAIGGLLLARRKRTA